MGFWAIFGLLEGEVPTQIASKAGFVDTFRYFYPDRTDAYSWWSYRGNARANNTGWRIDYFVVSGSFAPRLKDALIYPGVTGSDHCPVGLVFE